MPTPLSIADILEHLETFAPPSLAEDWDNVGLLWGDRTQSVDRVMTCLTLTEDVAQEAVEQEVDLVVTHHPLPFRPLKRVTTDSREGRILWQLARAGTAIYSPHTAFDSAAGGINEQLARGLGVASMAPLMMSDDQEHSHLGAGRWGRLTSATTLGALNHRVQDLLSIDHTRTVGGDDLVLESLAVACGSGGSFLESAIAWGADVLVTGEATFHTLLDAQAAGLSVVLTGHYASERFAVERLAESLADQLPECQIWASRTEHDPLRWKSNPRREP